MTLAILIAGAFLVGSIPFGVLIARLRGIDLQKTGSGNIGATNAARALGRGVGALVLILDAAKGFVPVVLARRLLAGREQSDWLVAAVALAAFLGHLFPPWLRFRGGKGIATGLGIFLAIAPLAAAAALVVWSVCYLVTRLSSLGSLAAASTLAAMIALSHERWPQLGLALVLYALILWKHRSNIERLFKRQEGKL